MSHTKLLEGTFAQDRAYIWSKFHHPELDESTGMPWKELKDGATAFFEQRHDTPWPVVKARAFAYLCKNMRIDVNPQDIFPTFACWNRDDRPLSRLLNARQKEIVNTQMEHVALWNDINGSGAGNQWVDFDHSVPDWYYILPLGFPGMLAKVREARARFAAEHGGMLTAEQDAYYTGIELTYEAMLEMLARFRDYARQTANGDGRVLAVADCLEALRTREPRTTYELMQFIYMYFMFSEHIDRMQVRSLGNLDWMMRPYMERDLAAGICTEADIRELWRYFLMQWGAIDNYWGHPFYLGGLDEQGNTRINPLSYLILEVFDELSIPSPKIQLRIAHNTPDSFLDLALKMIRKGNSSLVFCSEEIMTRVMLQYGYTPEDARTSDIRGCYEFTASGLHMGNTTGGGHVNMLKPFEWIFNDGVDTRLGRPLGQPATKLSEIDSFDEFYRAYLTNLQWIIESEITVGNDFERYQGAINPSNVFSAASRTSLATAKDAFWNGCYYNNTTLLNTGIASAVDALMMVKEFVFEKKELTLAELAACLKANWQGYEKLHEKVMHSRLKFGNGVPEVDKWAGYLGAFYGNLINGRPNARGGYWRSSGHCAKQYFVLGEKTMATPDGRYDGEEMSKNLSPVQGMDRKGLTALLKSVEVYDPMSFPGDFPLDVMLHPATVQGDEGLQVWRSLLRLYLEKIGCAIHFNIFDAETLKAAQREPEKYQGLQVRVCGWNVRFTTMAPKEQEMFIRRAENISE